MKRQHLQELGTGTQRIGDECKIGGAFGAKEEIQEL
jgi:hypothetical protein